MRDNRGFRPAELAALKERGLYDYLERWSRFVERGVPKVKKNRQVVPKLTHFLPLVNASISGFLRFGEGSFDGKTNSEMLEELILECDGELLEFIEEAKSMNSELVRASRT